MKREREANVLCLPTNCPFNITSSILDSAAHFLQTQGEARVGQHLVDESVRRPAGDAPNGQELPSLPLEAVDPMQIKSWILGVLLKLGHNAQRPKAQR